MNKILFHSKFILYLYMFLALCADYQEVKIVLYNIWYHHTETSEYLSLISVWRYQMLYNTILTYWWWAQ